MQLKVEEESTTVALQMEGGEADSLLLCVFISVLLFILPTGMEGDNKQNQKLQDAVSLPACQTSDLTLRRPLVAAFTAGQTSGCQMYFRL